MQKDYADKVINLLDPQKKLIKYRLYRNSCLNVKDAFVKDLNILGRELNKTIIVDNSLLAFFYQVLVYLTKITQVENGILIKTYEGDKLDRGLQTLMNAMMKIYNTDDVRTIIGKAIV